MMQKADGSSHFYHEPDHPGSLSHNYIQSMILDHRGELWIGTDGGGLNFASSLSPNPAG